MSYPFKQGIDYGPRDGTLGLSFHMAEGGNGTLAFLQRHVGEDLHEWAARVSGVSCNALLLSTGKVVQMLDWDHASGNLNPDDRAAEYGYYGHHHLVDVLGNHWPDPNTWTVSMEICGWRGGGAPVPAGVTPGPTDAQVKAAIAWGNQMKAMFPSIRGATGHHDQSPKACPGKTPNMKAIFDGVGGHGLWPDTQAPEDDMTHLFGFLDDLKPIGTVTVNTPPPGQSYQVVTPDGRALTVPPGQRRDCYGKAKLLKPLPAAPDDPATAGNEADRATVWVLGGITGATGDTNESSLLLAYAGTFAPDDAVAAEHERTRAAAIAALEALP